MTSELFVFHCTPVVSDTTPVAMAPLQPEGNGGVSLPLPPANWELRYFDLPYAGFYCTVIFCWPSVKSREQGV